ncbi:MAG: hypothetical protein ACYCYF_06110 [Anaerolineae bacterium]
MEESSGSLGAGVRSAKFDSYASRIGWNLLANLAPAGDDAPAGAGEMRDLLAALYAGIYEAPGAWRLAERPILEGDPRTRWHAPRQKLERELRGLWALGQRSDAINGDWRIRRAAWDGWLAEQKPQEARAMLDGLARAGVAVVEGEPVVLRCDARPQGWVLLAKLAQATATVQSGFLHFCRGDARAVAGAVAWRIDDAAASLEARDTAILRRLDAFALDLGCKRELLPPTLWWGEWRARYDHRKAGRTLCGFVVEEGALRMRSTHGDVAAIVPFVQQLPTEAQRWFGTLTACQNCGGCKGKEPLIVELDGRRMRLCWWGYSHDAPPPYDAMDDFEAIVRQQLALYSA